MFKIINARSRIMIQRRLIFSVLYVLIALSVAQAQSQSFREIHDLRGNWKFELGDDPKWASPSFDDSRWDDIYVPSPWEDEGYPGYDGYAWYRKHFALERRYQDSHLTLRLGNIDDVGEVYLNGHMIGFVGKFPPDFTTGYSISFECPVPQEFLSFGTENVLAVRVYDYRQAGGITRGTVGLFEPRDYLEPELDLSGVWKFSTGDNMDWRKPSFDDSRWRDIKAPLYWEAQGYRDYDGFAWYRRSFKVPADLAGKRLVLLVGRIDDADEVYLNGELIGRTGNMKRPMGRANQSTEWQQLRAYVLPPSLLSSDRDNIIAVRVLDVWQHGGIYDGPIGLVQRNRYMAWKDRPHSVWDFMRNIFR
jgi:hypothetical protein